MSRQSEIMRTTKETDISVKLSIDGGDIKIDTKIGFFEHMLTAFAHHGHFGLTADIKGDLHVDAHHTVEDAGIVLGQALHEALGDKRGIERFGHSYVPMDEALGFAALDISGRPFLQFDVCFPQTQIGEYGSYLTEEFLRAFCVNAGITLHVTCRGSNSHHMTEAVFKALGRALKQACTITGDGVSSTKGVL